MKKVWLLPIIFLIFGCKTQKSNLNSEEKPMISTNAVCPEDGKCTLEIFRNQHLNVLADEFGTTYYKMVDDPNSSVIRYYYDRNVPKDIQDAGYREEIVFEVKNSETNISLSNTELENTTMLFGRFCFCRGETGYYRVNEGNLKLTQKENTINFTLDFTISKVPQTIKNIQGNLK